MLTGGGLVRTLQCLTLNATPTPDDNAMLAKLISYLFSDPAPPRYRPRMTAEEKERSRRIIERYLATKDPKPAVRSIVPEPISKLTTEKAFLIKKLPLEQMSAHTLVMGLTEHMCRVAGTLTTHKVAHPKGTDPQFEQLATNLYKLATDLTTFLNKKGNISGEKTP